MTYVLLYGPDTQGHCLYGDSEGHMWYAHKAFGPRVTLQTPRPLPFRPRRGETLNVPQLIEMSIRESRADVELDGALPDATRRLPVQWCATPDGRSAILAVFDPTEKVWYL